VRRRSLTFALALLLAGLLGTACGAVPLPCDIAIAALPPGSAVEVGDPLPENVVLLARPADFDRGATSIRADTTGETAVELTLRGAAIAGLGGHTAGHIGESMAIAINGTVVAVPVIQGQIPDGKLQITGALGGEDLGQRFAGCSR
jgi:hypothetical protein